MKHVGDGKQQALVGQLLAWMGDRELKAQEVYDEALGELRTRLVGIYPPAASEYVIKILSGTPAEGSTLEHWQFLYWEAIDRDGWLLPVASLSYNFGIADPTVRMRIALFMLRQGSAGEHERAVGLRFESPEGDAGRHPYAHAQLITSWKKSVATTDAGRLRLPTPDWLPVSQPAMALDAVSALGTLVAMFVSLYGAGFSRRLKGAPFAGQLSQYLEGSRYLERLSS